MSDTTRKSDADTVVRLAAELAEANAELERIALAVGQWPGDDLAVKVREMRAVNDGVTAAANAWETVWAALGQKPGCRKVASEHHGHGGYSAARILVDWVERIDEGYDEGRREALAEANAEFERIALAVGQWPDDDLAVQVGQMRAELDECARMHKRLASAGFDDDVPFLQAVGLLLDEHRLLRAEIQRLNALPKALARPAEPPSHGCTTEKCQTCESEDFCYGQEARNEH